MGFGVGVGTLAWLLAGAPEEVDGIEGVRETIEVINVLAAQSARGDNTLRLRP